MVLLGHQPQAPDYCCPHTQGSSHFLGLFQAFNAHHTGGLLGQQGIAMSGFVSIRR